MFAGIVQLVYGMVFDLSCLHWLWFGIHSVYILGTLLC